MNRSLVYIVAFLVLAIATAFIIIKEDENIENKTELVSQDGYEVGDMATDFSLRDVSGKNVSLADYPDAEGYIVIFTCNHCPYAVAYEDRIIGLHNRYKDSYPLIAINPNNPEIVPEDSYDNMVKRAKEKGFEFAYLFDEKQEIFPQYGATKTPHVFLLEKGKSGNKVRYIGAIDNNYADASAVTEHYVVDAIESLKAGKEIEVKETKAIGCSIKK